MVDGIKMNEVQVQGEQFQQEEEQLIPEDISYNLKILPLTHSLHQKHGLRHNDFQRYRGYCSRRIARVRKAVKMVQGERKKFHKKTVTVENMKEEKCLEIPLMTVERAWAYAMQLKFEMNTEPRKKYHMITRLRKAEKLAYELKTLCMKSAKCDARTKLESQAYHLWISGTLRFEQQEWKKAMAQLTRARNIYEKLSQALSEDEADLYNKRMAEIVPSLRFCAYNCGDEAIKQEMEILGGQGRVEELINQAREEQAATLQEIEWKKRKMAVKHESVRMFLIREQEFAEELENAQTENGYEGQIEAYEGLLMDCKDGIQSLREELVEDPSFRNRQQTNEGAVTSTHFLYTYLCYLKCSKTIDRNLTMIEQLKMNLGVAVDATKGGDGGGNKKPVRAQDLVRLFETILQNLNEIPQLSGLEDDEDLKMEIEAKNIYFKAWRCNFLALAFLDAKKWSEAMALYQRATEHAKRAANDSNLNDNLKKQVPNLLSLIESRQFMARANSCLEVESKTGSQEVENKDLASKPLLERLDVYYQDPELVKGKAQLANFPPSFEPVPCKPLFFDLAREKLEFPSLDAKLQGNPNSPQKGGASGGWLGGWIGGWGGNKK